MDENPPLSAQAYDRIMRDASNPYRMRSVAHRLLAYTGDADMARDMARTLLSEALARAARLYETRGGLTERLAGAISSRLGLERAFVMWGIPASLQRAGLAFMRERARLRASGVDVPRGQWGGIWDRAVRDLMARQEADRAAGRRRGMRWLPLADGRSSNPESRRRLSCGGLDAWLDGLERIRGQARADRGGTGFHADVENVEAPVVEHDARFLLSAAWLRRHGITPDMLARVDGTLLDHMGVDVAEDARALLSA